MNLQEKKNEIHCSISVIKNFVLYADITKSISLLTFDKECKTLSVISRDYEPMEVYRCEYVVDGTNLGFMVSDSNCNLVIYSYQVCHSVSVPVSQFDLLPMAIVLSDRFSSQSPSFTLEQFQDLITSTHIFQPEAVESQGGMKLIRKSDINIGAHVNTFFRTGIRIHDGTILGTTASR